VFCCFNGTHKISRFTFERWLDILEAVKGSVLWLLDTSEQTKQRLHGMAEQRGVSPARLIFAPKISPTCSWIRRPMARIPRPRTRCGWAFRC
jgi:predicted O-linked N-acetylglucosamine transferase (SPINDLY family)